MFTYEFDCLMLTVTLLSDMNPNCPMITDFQDTRDCDVTKSECSVDADCNHGSGNTDTCCYNGCHSFCLEQPGSRSCSYGGEIYKAGETFIPDFCQVRGNTLNQCDVYR